MSYNYMASPYSSPNPNTMEDRYHLAAEALVWLLERKIWTYSPIVHCHHIAKHYDMPKTFAFWAAYNKAMLKDAMGFLILAIDGWDESVGVAEEMKWATKYKIMTKFLHRTDKGVYAIRSSQ